MNTVIVCGQEADFDDVVNMMDPQILNCLYDMIPGPIEQQIFVDSYIRAHKIAFLENFTIN